MEKISLIFHDLAFFLLSLTIEDLVKFFAISGIFVYLFFAFALMRQVRLMAEVVEVGVAPVFKILSMIHFIASIAIFILAFVWL